MGERCCLKGRLIRILHLVRVSSLHGEVNGDQDVHLDLAARGWWM